MQGTTSNAQKQSTDTMGLCHSLHNLDAKLLPLS